MDPFVIVWLIAMYTFPWIIIWIINVTHAQIPTWCRFRTIRSLYEPFPVFLLLFNIIWMSFWRPTLLRRCNGLDCTSTTKKTETVVVGPKINVLLMFHLLKLDFIIHNLNIHPSSHEFYILISWFWYTICYRFQRERVPWILMLNLWEYNKSCRNPRARATLQWHEIKWISRRNLRRRSIIWNN